MPDLPAERRGPLATTHSNARRPQQDEKVIAINYKSESIVGKISREEVELMINKIIADKAGLDLDEVTPEKKICHDLGID